MKDDKVDEKIAKQVALWYSNIAKMSKDEKLSLIERYVKDRDVKASEDDLALLRLYMTESDDATLKSIDKLTKKQQETIANLSLGLAAYANGVSSAGLMWKA